MNVLRLHVANDPEAGCALALLLAAAGYETETDIVDGDVLIFAESEQPEIEIEDPEQLAFQMRRRLDEIMDEVILSDMGDGFGKPAA